MYSKDVQNIAIRLYSSSIPSLRKVAVLLNTSHSTISRWVNGLHINTVPKVRTTKLDGRNIIDALNLYITMNPFASIKDIQQMISTTFKINVSKELIRLTIVRNNFTRKRARYHNEAAHDSEKLKDFLEKRKEYVNERRIFLSIDETSFGRNYQPAIGYAKKGSRLHVKRPKSHMTTYSVIAAAGVSRPLHYSIHKDSVNAEVFSKYLSTIEAPPKTVLLMDNVSFHHSYRVREVASSRGWDILFVPPYSPVFNPIEGVFSITKRQYQQTVSIDNSFSVVTSDHVASFFKHSFAATHRFS